MYCYIILYFVTKTTTESNRNRTINSHNTLLYNQLRGRLTHKLTNIFIDYVLTLHPQLLIDKELFHLNVAAMMLNH